MKNSILNLGKALLKADQKKIKGGAGYSCYQDGRLCCQTGPSGFTICDAGVCNYPGQRCMFY
ncbi:hypothetical protein [Tenacibaculum sp. IB213877]|uniref:hypothetical protein n=1 Tax=Tenacibaculum sp. IB213877 TaxID=3097351 RepID=UPI002A5A8CDF|nr:hypothetical protein [Tenacibaculum sp. IB213877]MDY0780809.1 hypothetical protein [Tenacibaculum sp. IB213877]